MYCYFCQKNHSIENQKNYLLFEIVHSKSSIHEYLTLKFSKKFKSNYLIFTFFALGIILETNFLNVFTLSLEQFDGIANKIEITSS